MTGLQMEEEILDSIIQAVNRNILTVSDQTQISMKV